MAYDWIFCTSKTYLNINLLGFYLFSFIMVDIIPRTCIAEGAEQVKPIMQSEHLHFNQ